MTSYEKRLVLFLHDREAIRRSSHSPIDNCGLFIRHQEYKSQVTSYKYSLCSHSLEQSRRQYSFFSRSAKPACGFKQLHNKRPRKQFFSVVLTFITAPKIQIHSNFRLFTVPFFFVRSLRYSASFNDSHLCSQMNVYFLV